MTLSINIGVNNMYTTSIIPEGSLYSLKIYDSMSKSIVYVVGGLSYERATERAINYVLFRPHVSSGGSGDGSGGNSRGRHLPYVGTNDFELSGYTSPEDDDFSRL